VAQSGQELGAKITTNRRKKFWGPQNEKLKSGERCRGEPIRGKLRRLTPCCPPYSVEGNLTAESGRIHIRGDEGAHCDAVQCGATTDEEIKEA